MKSFLVTGASRGLGEAIVRQLQNLGHRVMACARSEERLKELWQGVANVEWTACDLSEWQDAEKLLNRTMERFGSLDGLVNNAGTIQPIDPLEQCDSAEWARAITLNLTTPTLMIRAALPYLRKSRGRVVNISTGAAVKVVQGWSAYCASKAGFLHLTQVVAVECPEVGFFSLRPGVIDTGMQSEIRDSAGMTESDLAKFKGLKESGSLEPPEVPARSAVWLALHGPLDRSGELIEYTDDQVQSGAQELFAVRGPVQALRRESTP
ncbi:MAG: SDR family NAD(P)-dependent oxidoreductase [Vulcanimicrobiota bacterium]